MKPSTSISASPGSKKPHLAANARGKGIAAAAFSPNAVAVAADISLSQTLALLLATTR
jgi:hypothetical protein